MSDLARVSAGARALVRVPASSANLGPAFDAAGLALTLYDDVEVEVLDAGCDVQVEGEGAQSVPLDESHLVVRALQAGLAEAGLALPGVSLRAVNRVPHGRGLGSSSAATVAGLLAARGLAETVGRASLLGDHTVLRLATAFEGHADNVGATLVGGLTLVWDADGAVAWHRVDVHEDLAVLALVPGETLSTARARGLIPASVPHRAAAFNAGRSALLVTALTDDLSLLLPATDDRLHQPYRAGAFPESMQVVAELRDQGHAAVISGAGPSVVVLGRRSDLAAVEQPAGWRLHHLGVDATGARLHATSGTR